ncbi:MAG TPA: ATP-binding cassette domain-containing protein, partial [Candidatus Eisenbacteria bacterium]|nr:ATP-binding cassette domain-containing protein [Candidatus Eisenbacteria bacterium]
MTTSASQPVTATATAARAEQLTKVYGEGDTSVVALDAVSCAFARGNYTAIMGPSGSGKSTLMHCMAGLDSVTSGSVFIGDTDLTGLDDNALTRLRRDSLGFVF